MYFCSMHCYTVCWFDVFTAKFSPRVWGSSCVHHQTGIPTLQVQGWVSISTWSLAAVLFFLFCFDSSLKQCEALPFYVEILPSFAPFYCTVKMDFIPHRIIFAKQCHVISKEINLCKNCFECYRFRNRRTKNLPVCCRKITYNKY